MELVTKDELATLKRNAEQFRGNAPLIQRLVQSGIKSPDDLDGVLTPVKQARELGLDLNGLLASVTRPAQPAASPDQDRPLTMSALSAFMDEREARSRHEAAQAAEDQMFGRLVSELAGEKASEAERAIAEDLTYGMIARNTALYESGPFKGKVRPLSEREFSEVASAAKERWKSMRGQRLEEVAANAGTARPTPPAPGGAGAATTTGNTKPRPGTPEHRAMVMEQLERLQTGRSGAPLSQA